MKAHQIAERVRVHFCNYDYALDNTYVFEWESDFFAISKSGYCVEVEIKVSKSDFKNDFKKTKGFSKTLKHDYIADKKTTAKPNKFFFAIPENLVDYADIPKEYGILIMKSKYDLVEIRTAKFLHKEKLLKNVTWSNVLLKKFYFRNIDLMNAMEYWRHDIKFGQQRLDRTRY